VPEVDPVILQLRADVSRYRNELRATTTLVDRSLRDQERAVQRLEFQFQRSGNAIGNTLGSLKAALGSVSAIALARQFLEYADAAKQVDAQLRLATRSFGSFAQAQDDARRIAGDTRTSLEATSSLYGNFIRATQSLGGSQDEAARATETFSKALKIGGADANAAASATLQFGQALASGALRGDEFNSIAEASPRILQLLADAIGAPRSQVRALAADGKLTSDVLFRALTDRRFTAGIDAEFAQLPVTFDEAMGQVRNAAIITFGAFDRGGEFSTALANFITDGTGGFADLEDAAERLGIQIRSEFAGLSDAFGPMLDGALSAFSQINASAAESSAYIRTFLTTLDQVANFGRDAFNAAALTAQQTVNFLAPGTRSLGRATPVGGRSNLAGRYTQGQDAFARAGSARSRIRAAAERLEKAGYVVPLNPDGTVDQANIRRRQAAVAEPRAAETGKGKKKKGPSAETLARRAEAQQQRELRNDEAYENEKAALNHDLLQARQAMATAADTLAQFELQEIEAARVRQNASYQADVAQKKLTQARADELVALNDAVAAERSRAVRLREEERVRSERAQIAEADLVNARDIALGEDQLADTTAARRASAMRLLDLEYQMERARLEAIEASTQSTDAEKEIARRRLALLPQLEASDRAGVERDNEGSYARYRRQLPDTIDEVNDRLDDVKVDTMRALEDEIVNTTKSALGLQGALGDVVGELVRIGVQRKLMGPAADFLFGKADGSTSGSIGSLLGSVFGRASGGYVAPGQVVRVNEQGGRQREFFQAGTAGANVISAGSAGALARGTRGGATVMQTVVVDARGAVMNDQFARLILARAGQQAQQVVALNNRATRAALPGEQVRFDQLGTTG
jgi:tape measure domain-containing protein